MYSATFGKLLELADTTLEPTAYHLLHIDPREASPGWIDAALRYWRLRVRLEAPGPLHVPMIEKIDHELQAAAAVLKDPARKAAYDAELLQQAASRRVGDQQRRTERMIEDCRKAVSWVVDHGGAVDDTRRADLTRRLRLLGLDSGQIQAVQDAIPSAARAESRPAGPVLEHFSSTVELVLADGALEPSREQKLLELADRLMIPRAAAATGIEQRLAARGASRVPEGLAPQEKFAEAVRKAKAESPCTVQKRQGLFEAGLKRALPAAAVYEVIRDVIGETPQAAKAATPPAPAVTPLAAMAASVAAAEATAPTLSPIDDTSEPLTLAPEPAETFAPDSQTFATFAEPRIQQPAMTAATAAVEAPRKGVNPTILACVAAGGGAILATLGILAYFHFAGKSLPAPPVQPGVLVMAHDPNHGAITPGAATAPVTGPFRPPQPYVPPDVSGKGNSTAAAAQDKLLQTLLAATSRQAQLDLVARASPEQIKASLLAGADVLARGGYREQQEAARVMEAMIFGSPPAPVVAQDAAVRALISAMRDVQGKAGNATAAARPLAKALFLEEYTSYSSVEMFAARCEAAWDESSRTFPKDPMNDPARLAASVAAGGSNQLLSARMDTAQILAVWAELARMASGSGTQAEAAFQQIRSAAGRSSSSAYSPELVQQCRLALCDIIAATDTASRRSSVHSTLKSALSIRYEDPLYHISEAADGEAWRQVADDFRRLVQAGGSASIAPAGALRAAWSQSGDACSLLVDLAMATMACRERACRLAGEQSPVVEQFNAALRESAGSGRLGFLAQKVTFEYAPGPAGDANSSKVDKTMEPYVRILAVSSKAQRWKAVDDLQEMDTPQASDVLLKLVEAAAKRTIVDEQASLASRALTALSQMTDKAIPERLIKALESCSGNTFACRISRTLAEGYAMSSYSSRTPTLPLRHTAKDQAAAAAAWRAAGQSSRIQWGSRYSSVSRRRRELLLTRSRSYSGNDAAAPAALLAFTAGQADAAARRIATISWSGNSPATKYEEKVVAVPGAGEAMVAAMEAEADQLGRLARKHSVAGKFGAELDGVAAAHKSRNLACASELQKAAVAMGTQGAYLAVMVRMSDNGGKLAQAIKEVSKRRAASMARVKTVFEEMRESSYYNLLLWDLLLQCQGNKP